MMYWQKEIETMDRKDLVKFQLERLKQTIELAGNSPFYHKIFKEKGITPDSFQSLEDLQKLPFTTKDDLRNNYPFGLAAIPLQKCVRIHSSSGTTSVVGCSSGQCQTGLEWNCTLFRGNRAGVCGTMDAHGCKGG